MNAMAIVLLNCIAAGVGSYVGVLLAEMRIRKHDAARRRFIDEYSSHGYDEPSGWPSQTIAEMHKPNEINGRSVDL